MDIIFFEPENGLKRCFYRKHRCHSFIVGKEGVVRIEKDILPQTLPASRMEIENVAGKFNDFLRVQDIQQLIKKTRRGKQLFHVYGTLNIINNTVHFKGCRGLSQIHCIARDIGLLDFSARVYMALITGNLGFPVDVRDGSYLEHMLCFASGGSFVSRPRIIDLHTMVYFEMQSWSETYFPEVPRSNRPTKILVSVSSRGTIIVRLSYPRILWSAMAEHHCEKISQWILTQIQSFC
jgi:hypothetical protein